MGYACGIPLKHPKLDPQSGATFRSGCVLFKFRARHVAGIAFQAEEEEKEKE